MKGILFSLGDRKTSKIGPIDALRKGMFGVWMSASYDKKKHGGKIWSKSMLDTISDYLCVSPGDKVFFFQNRRIYGIGEVVPALDGARIGSILNYPKADIPDSDAPNEDETLLTTGRNWKKIRIIVPFIPSPGIFREGMDMDEVLSSPGAEECWSLRSWEKRSFIRLGPSETRVLMGAFLRRFHSNLKFEPPEMNEEELRSTIKDGYHGTPSPSRIIRENPDRYVLKDGRIDGEKLLHSLLAEQMMEGESFLPSSGGDSHRGMRIHTFHEVCASPPKPPIWMDKMDFLRMHELRNANCDVPSHFDVIEAKREKVPNPIESPTEIYQVMKYVDFISWNYAAGDYGAVSAYLISKDVKKRYIMELEGGRTEAIRRSYVLDPREKSASRTWNDLKLLTYDWNHSKGIIELKEAYDLSSKKT